MVNGVYPIRVWASKQWLDRYMPWYDPGAPFEPPIASDLVFTTDAQRDRVILMLSREGWPASLIATHILDLRLTLVQQIQKRAIERGQLRHVVAANHLTAVLTEVRF